MRPLFVVILVAASAQVASAKPGPGPLDDVALKDRCAMAVVVAKQIRDVEELTGSLPAKSGRLQFFIAVYRKKQGDYRSILDADDVCPSARIPRTYFQGSPVDISFAGGTQQDLNPDLHYVLVRSKRMGNGRWAFTWKVGDSVTGCRRGGRCAGPVALIANNPTLKMLVVRQSGRFKTAWARLEMLAHDDAVESPERAAAPARSLPQ
jgi:hypothetical protein